MFFSEQPMKIFRNWVYSNIHIALIAAALSLETNVLLNVRPMGIAPGLIFCATLLVYNLGYFNAVFSKKQSYREQARWMKANVIYWVFSILISLLGLIYLIAKFDFYGQLTLAVLGFTTFIYILHDVNLFGKHLSIRSIPYLKVFIVALTWSAITILPQLVDSREYLAELYWTWLILERFFFILSITLMFDVRDLNNDPKHLHTIPQSIGIKQTKGLSIFLLAIATLFLFQLNLNTYQFIGTLLVYFSAIFMIYNSQPIKDDIYYTGWFDGLIGLHALAIIGFHFWP